MKHATILCLPSDRASTLDKMGELGLVHIESSISESSGIAQAATSLQAAECVREAVAAASKATSISELRFRTVSDLPADTPQIISSGIQAINRFEQARQKAASLAAEEARYAPWGDFDPEAIKTLADSGVNVSLFKVPRALAETLQGESGGVVVLLQSDKESAWGALIGGSLPEGVSAFPLPQKRLSAIQSELADIRSEMKSAAKEISELASHNGEIDTAIRAASAELEVQTASANLIAEGPVCHISGWIPEDGAKNLCAAANASGWGVSIRDPDPGETPPVQLRPPKIFRPILAVFKALGIIPGYEETDVSVPFYLFFTLFFAMLIGDAGYGALILLAWFFIRRKVRRSGASPSPAVSSILTLLLVFGAATVVWGALTATWFGIPHDAAHPWLPEWMIPPTAKWLGDQAIIMHVCFSIGLVHLLLARFWNITQLCPDSRALAEIGWSGILVAMYCIVCSIAIPYFSYPAWASWILGVSVLLVLFFTYKRSELKENAVSLAMTPLNVISSMGDVISYVRLFAVSLAAVKIAETFNTMAGDLGLPLWAKIPVMVLILLLGHALNLAMSALSILVHAVRLNTLEFSSAKGISWSGNAYSPFHARRGKSELRSLN